MVERKKPKRGQAQTERDPRFKALSLLVEHLWLLNGTGAHAAMDNLALEERNELLAALELVRGMVDG